jgi:hypothetical protein
VNPSTLAPARLARLRTICLSFPETAERVSFGDPNWTVNGKGWLAIYLDPTAIDWSELAELVEDSYR